MTKEPLRAQYAVHDAMKFPPYLYDYDRKNPQSDVVMVIANAEGLIQSALYGSGLDDARKNLLASCRDDIGKFLLTIEDSQARDYLNEITELAEGVIGGENAIDEAG